MRHSKQSHEIDEVFARLDAEDRAVVYLANFPPQVALATALSVERSLATIWEVEQNRMIRTGDPREAVAITVWDKKGLDAAFAKIPPGVQSDAAAKQHVIDLLAKFPPDRAWWIARTVTQWAAGYARKEHIKAVA